MQDLAFSYSFSKMLLKKKPTAFDTIYSVSFCTIALNKNNIKPDQTRITILTGGTDLIALARRLGGRALFANIGIPVVGAAEQRDGQKGRVTESSAKNQIRFCKRPRAPLNIALLGLNDLRSQHRVVMDSCGRAH